MKARVNLAYSYQMVGQFQRAWNELTVAIAVNDSESSILNVQHNLLSYTKMTCQCF